MLRIAVPRLVPVICLKPSDFGQVASPPGPWSVEVAAQYWHECLSQSGLGDLSPIRVGSWHVSVAQILKRRDLATIVRGLSHAFDDTIDDELPLGFPGGCALFDGGTVIFEPQCCGDLTAHADWEAAAAYRGAESAMLWIGHPWLEMRYVDPDLALRMSTETPGNLPPEYFVDPESLRESLGPARDAQSKLGARLTPILRELGIARAPDFALALAGFGKPSVSGAG